MESSNRTPPKVHSGNLREESFSTHLEAVLQERIHTWIYDEGHDVRYCEAVVASHNSPFPRSHAWLRVDGVDYNITSEDGEALHIYSNYPMVVMPIHKMRPSGGDKYEDTPYLGRSLSEFSEHPRVKPYFHSNVLPEMISQYQSNSILEIERTFGE